MKNMKKRGSVALIVCLMLAVCLISIGGTIAWLTDSTEPVVNTFSPTNIDVTLEETTPALVNGARTVQIIPGVDIDKDPKVSASSNVPYYLFVKVEKTDWNSYLSYTINSEWTQLSGVEGVYYMDVEDGRNVTAISVLAGDKVYVDDNMTKEDMLSVNSSLTFTAYAIQKADGGADNEGNFTAAEAWAQLTPSNP